MLTNRLIARPGAGDPRCDRRLFRHDKDRPHVPDGMPLRESDEARTREMVEMVLSVGSSSPVIASSHRPSGRPALDETSPYRHGRACPGHP